MSLIYTSSPVVRRSPSYKKTRLTLLGQKKKVGNFHNNKLSKKLTSAFLSMVIVFSLLFSGVFLIPKIVYAFYDPNTLVLTNSVNETALGGDVESGPKHSNYLPEINENLPQDNWLEIPFIGVRSLIHETQNPEDALDQGVWLDPAFGVPGEGKTVILAAHRYGWKWWWKDEYWRYNSFYNLPETEVGDVVEITYGQRKFVYEIYLATEGEEITDFNADLILYTCKYLDSPIRYFRYARLIDPTQDSQSL